MAILLFLTLTMARQVAEPAWADEPSPAGSVETSLPLPVNIGGKDYALDALVVRRPGEDKLPVALITHGSSSGDPRVATPDWLRGWAHDMAQRGWLAVAVMRRGYGKSDGEVANDAGTCAAPNVGRYLDAHADDLEAALRAISQRPDADMGHVLAIGDSAGGAAVMALAGRMAVTLSAAVNVSGGLGRRLAPFHPNPACSFYDSDLVWNFARFGATARMPTLWLYAENDSWFRPGLVARMRAAFTGSGGQAELVMLPPFGADGHALFFGAGGRQLLLPELDRFLSANSLPTWDEKAFSPFLATLAPTERDSVMRYLQAPSEKALALAPDRRAYWRWGEPRIEDARKKAMSECAQKAKVDCSIAAENFVVRWHETDRGSAASGR